MISPTVFLLLSSFWIFLPDFVLGAGAPRPLAVGLLVLCAAAAFLLGIASRGLYGLSVLVLLLLNAVYVHLRYHWGLELSESRFEAAFAGEPSETLEYVKIYFGTPEALFFLYALAAVYLMYRFFRSGGFSGRARIGAAAALLPLLLLLALLRAPLAHVPPMFLVHDAGVARTRLGQIAKRSERIRAAQGTALVCSENYDKIVIVIGESAFRDRMSFYGYPEKTTPFLDSLRPYRFNGLAAANQTRYAVPLLLSHATVRDFQGFFRGPGLVSELKACGYETWWISNQGGLGQNENYVTSLAEEADHQSFLSSLDYLHPAYDERIVDTLDKYAARDTRKQAFFLHLRGSHFDYGQRTPRDFSWKAGTDIGSEYDKTLAYTDHVLSEIFNRMKGDGLLFAYASDHGEVVSDTLHGHGFFPGFQEEYRIPMIVWTRKPRGKVLKEVAGEDPVNAESFTPMLEYLAGLREKPELSQSSEVISLSPENVRDYNRLGSAFPTR